MELGFGFTDEHYSIDNDEYHTDYISDNPWKYIDYVNAGVGVFNDSRFLYNSKVTNSNPDLRIFNYVVQEGMTRDENIFIFRNFIDYKNGKTSFSFSTKNEQSAMMKMLNSLGIEYTEGITQSTYTFPENFSNGEPAQTYTITNFVIEITAQ